MVGNNSSNLPPGFRFHPTDEELIIYYLRNQATSRPCPASIIPEVDIYKFDPWELPEKAEFGENEWYFFSPRDRKYPNGARPNRAAVSGYWKATGTDKSIYSGSKYVGIKKALVFYKGKPPKGAKTDWIMHEYRLSDSTRPTSRQNGSLSMRLDDWVLCRIYKKKNMGRVLEQGVEELGAQIVTTNDVSDSPMLKFPRTSSLSHLWELDCLGSLSQLLNDNSYNSNSDYQNMMGSAGNGARGIEKIQLGELDCLGSLSQLLNDNSYNSNSDYQNMMGSAGNGARGIEKIQLGELPYQYMDSMKFQADHSGAVVMQPTFVNPLFQFK